MSSWSPSLSRPFTRWLIVVLSEEVPTSSSEQNTLLFNRLLELEMAAEREGTPEASCRVITRVRRLAGAAASEKYLSNTRGN